MIFSRSDTEVATRLSLNGETLERIEAVKLVGVWLTTYLDWERNTKELCKKAYARITMLTKLKYVGVNREELVNIYILYVRSLLEYCAVVWHSTLTVEQKNNIEIVQKLCLKIILGPEYSSYENALRLTGLESLYARRENRCLQYALKSLLHPVHYDKFPVNPQVYIKSSDERRNKEHFIVNWAKSESYRMSAIPYMQRMLNDYVHKKK